MTRYYGESSSGTGPNGPGTSNNANGPGDPDGPTAETTAPAPAQAQAPAPTWLATDQLQTLTLPTGGDKTPPFPQPQPPPQPAGPPAPTWPGPKTPRDYPHWFLPAIIGVCVVLVAGATWLAWPTSSGPSNHLVAGTVQATVLSADEVSSLAGTTVIPASSASVPPAPLTADKPACVVSVGPATQAVYGRTWTGFLSVTYQDVARKGSITVTQVAAVFPNADGATAAFKTLTGGLGGCPSSSVTDRSGRATQWQYKVGTQAPASVSWTATENGASSGWACHHQARVTGTSLLQVAVCDAGNGDAIAAKVADQFAARVKG